MYVLFLQIFYKKFELYKLKLILYVKLVSFCIMQIKQFLDTIKHLSSIDEISSRCMIAERVRKKIGRLMSWLTGIRVIAGDDTSFPHRIKASRVSSATKARRFLGKRIKEMTARNYRGVIGSLRN